MGNSISTSPTRLSLSEAPHSSGVRLVDLGIYARHISASLSGGDSVRPFPFSLSANKGIINLFSLPAGTKMFQFPAYSCISAHSEILGSKLACSSPKLIAACHVLHRNQNQAIRLTASVIVCLFPSKSNFRKTIRAYFIVNMTQNDP